MYETGVVATAAAAATATDPTKTLPFTGAASTVLLGVAVLFLTIGILLRVIAGRRSNVTA